MVSTTNTPERWFSSAERLVAMRLCADWDLVLGDGPVVATAVHDGHRMRDSLKPHLAIDDAQRRRDEDPLTGLLTSAGDVRLRVRTSRFEVDLNRPRDKALSADPADTWGITFWRDSLPASEIERSLLGHDRFYAMFRALMNALIDRWGCVFVLDIHSYNHRRDGPDAASADQAGNPDIELGVTTLDHGRWGKTAERFADALRSCSVAGREPDVRNNVRYPTGGHFPEWLFSVYGDKVCTISPEYKKIYMDEWTGQVDIDTIEDFRRGLEHAVATVRSDFLA